MTTHVLTCGIAGALCVVLAILFLSVARAPAWRRYRNYAAASLVVAVYALASMGYALPTPWVSDLLALALTSALFFIALRLSTQVTGTARGLVGLNDQLEERIAAGTKKIMLARAALLTSEKYTAMGQLAAGVSHEVNNPLSYVRGNLDYIHEILVEDHDQEDSRTLERLAAVVEAQEGAERVRQIVVGLAAYARSAATSGAACVEDAIDVAMRVVRPQTKFNMAIKSEIDKVPAAAIDESKLVQVLVSILLNAADSCQGIDPVPETLISAGREDKSIVIEIRDHGRGMDPAVLETAFQPLSRGDRDKGEVGLGLGLYLSRSLMEAAGGRIDIVSAPGQGTTVRLCLLISPEKNLNLSQSLTPISIEPDAEAKKNS